MDTPNLIRYRDQVLSLDCSFSLTRGNPAGFGALFNLLHPAKGSFTAVIPAHGGLPVLIGQVVHDVNDFAASLTFLLPEDMLSEENLFPMLDELTCRAGEMGAYSVKCELNENHAAFNSFRRAGFFAYAWQHIWKIPVSTLPLPETGNPWEECRGGDEVLIRNLYQSLVPPLVQGNENPMPLRNSGWVVRQGDEILAYAEGIFGTQGIMLNTIFHPEVENVHDLILHLVDQLPRLNRPVYMAVRLYQAHIEHALGELGAEHSPMKALLVKQLTNALKVEVLLRQKKAIKVQHAEPSAPMIRNASGK